jgi:AcrR family transcriptional regulator
MQHGYGATSIDMIAEALGATKGRIYYHYRTKADLFFELHRVAMEMNLETIRPFATEAAPAKDRLERMVIAHVGLVMRELPLQCVSVQGVQMHLAGSTTPAQRKVLVRLIEARDEYERLYFDVLTQGIEAGEFRSCDPRTLVKPLLGALNWMTVWYRVRATDTEEMRRHIAQEHATFLVQGVLKV